MSKSAPLLSSLKALISHQSDTCFFVFVFLGYVNLELSQETRKSVMTKSMKIKIKENLPNCRWGVWANNFLVMKKHHRMVLVFDRTPPLYR
ncbi:PREDICTED: uncharacterized protein LOC107352628 isoform X3 [Acropora digitifera]|uniref:uncharacterized protein LOC107352628 isoform X3 n=1 Tax=Acropora digitifera TaxID=70779 RepID=UPI00077ABE41|nr:PREDICTED: uncharacterized protein LOC107352628 isoform X3 [Acropora digitifera]